MARAQPRKTDHPDPRGHHFVPVMVQKRFADQEGWLHAFNRRKTENDVFRIKPENLFLKRDLYTTVEASGERRADLETSLSKLESLAECVIARLIEAARSDKAPNLSRNELTTWLMFFHIQWRRVPDLHLEVTTDAETERILDDVIEEAKLRYPHRVTEIDRFLEPGPKRRILKNARTESVPRVPPFVMDALRSRGIAIAKIDRSDKQFIVGSRPVVKLAYPGKTDIRHPECEMWFPISSDVMVGLGRGCDTETRVAVKTADVRHINLAIAKQSTMFASASPKLTASLAQAR